MKSLILLMAAFCLCSCATIIEGRSQQILVNTNPSGANCNLLRQGETIASIASTPGGAYIEKTKYDLTIECTKKGYEKSTFLNHSGIDDVTFGDIVLGGVIGWGVDSAVGADNKYTSPVNITLPRAEAPRHHKHQKDDSDE